MYVPSTLGASIRRRAGSPARLALAALLIAVALAGGCGDSRGDEAVPIDHNQAALNAPANVESVLLGLARAMTFLEESELLGGILTADSVTATCCDGTGTCSPCGGETETETQSTTSEELDSATREAVDILRTRVLTEANLESQDGLSVTYLLDPNVTCTLADGSLDEDCHESLSRTAVRLVLTAPREGDVDVTVQLGDDRASPVTIHLYQDRLGVTTDLGESMAAYEELAATDPEIEGSSYDVIRASGRVRFELIRHAEQVYESRVTVVEGIDIAMSEGTNQYAFRLAASTPLSIRLDGAARELTSSLDVGLLEMELPIAGLRDAFAEDNELSSPTDPALPEPTMPEPTIPDPTGVLSIVLGGLNGSVTFGAAEDALTIEGLGLGDVTSRIAYDDQTLVSVDLNANAGRRFDLTIKKALDGRTLVEVRPSFELAVSLAFEHIAAQFAEGEIPDYALRDDLRFTFDGAEVPTLAFSEDSALGDAIEILAGTIRATSSARPEDNFEASAGMCLYEEEVESVAGGTTDPSSSEGFLSGMTAGTCGG